VLRTLGKGSFGKVKEALHVLSNEKIAVKILEKERIQDQSDEVRVRREMDILLKVHHPFVVQLYEIVETSKYYFFIMENAARGDLACCLDARGR
jgi:5'-AMP-activated protein kinase catalytic alpha subunit